jgi:hypothetical protein
MSNNLAECCSVVPRVVMFFEFKEARTNTLFLYLIDDCPRRFAHRTSQCLFAETSSKPNGIGSRFFGVRTRGSWRQAQPTLFVIQWNVSISNVDMAWINKQRLSLRTLIWGKTITCQRTSISSWSWKRTVCTRYYLISYNPTLLSFDLDEKSIEIQIPGTVAHTL